MKDGQQFRLRGSAGALFMVTVGQPFTQAEITKRLDSGEWSYPDAAAEAVDPGPGDQDEPPIEPKAADPSRPAANAPKAEWVTYVARTEHMSREDAANYTKADLIDMVS